MNVSFVLALVDDWKITTNTSCRGSRQSWALVRARCSNQIQVEQGQVLVLVGSVSLCKLQLVA